MRLTLRRVTHLVAAAGLVGSAFVVTRAESQNPNPQRPRPESFPAQQRPPGDPALICRSLLETDARHPSLLAPR